MVINRSFQAFFLVIVLLLAACTKLDTTDLGLDLIPEVDNINTFADTIDISSAQFVFNDSTKLSSTDLHVLGNIDNDPLAGSTRANIYVQLKPLSYPYYFGSKGDTINNSLAPGTGFDSVVLCLSYKGFWGDSTAPLGLDVYKVNSNNGLWDSVFKAKDINYEPDVSDLLGSRQIDVRALGGYFKYANKRDSAKGQIRIRLTGMESGSNNLFTRDTLTNNSFRSDSLYKLFNNGFGIKASSGKGLMYISLIDTSTKLEIHYRRKNGGKVDTSYSSFKLYTSVQFDTSKNIIVTPSVTCNRIIRNRSALPSGSEEILMQTQPGTYATLNVDSLSRYANRVIHRASIQVQELAGDPFTDSLFTPPGLLYMDVRDTSVEERWKPVYLDLSPSTSYDPDNKTGSYYFPLGGVDFGYFGGYLRQKTDNEGNRVRYYDFNLTRHVQRIVTRKTPNYQFRLYSPFRVIYPQYSPLPYNYGNRIAFGRVKLAGGKHPLRPMKMVIIYSLLK